MLHSEFSKHFPISYMQVLVAPFPLKVIKVTFKLAYAKGEPVGTHNLAGVA